MRTSNACLPQRVQFAIGMCGAKQIEVGIFVELTLRSPARSSAISEGASARILAELRVFPGQLFIGREGEIRGNV